MLFTQQQNSQEYIDVFHASVCFKENIAQCIIPFHERACEWYNVKTCMKCIDLILFLFKYKSYPLCFLLSPSFPLFLHKVSTSLYALLKRFYFNVVFL